MRETLLVHVLMYGSEIVLRKKKPRIQAVQMDNLRGLLGIRRMDRALNAQIMEVVQSDERIDEGIFQWFNHVERVENDGLARRFYVGECAGKPWKRWVNTVKDCLRKRGLDISYMKPFGINLSVAEPTI